MPGSNARALEKARGLPADALILDLEDAVSPDAKDAARDLVAGAVGEGGYGARRLMIRINGLDTRWGAEDLEAALSVRPHAILLPKVARARDVAVIADTLSAADPNHPTTLWAMIETPLGVLNAAEIARAPRMAGFVLGTNDLAKDLHCRGRTDRLPLLGALSQALLAARAAGILCIDGVYNAFRDDAGLRAECEQGRDLGFDGKSLIHPAQIAIANDVFAPTEAEIALARAQVAAHDAAHARGEGVAVLNGRIVENLHVETARQTLAKAQAIADMG
ncbi:CoA ester lyase [Rhodobacteraceae bacterium 2CG4]|uniref:CoA ester lyase n=2 Tax=Halovulum marinum TaxID=2662447 RepID=A0A6L5Z0F7_9RHOB|nr:CoA ester lyase [Halovulum marinum]